MEVGAVFAMTLPGLVVLLVALAVIERVASRLRRRSLVSGVHRSALSAVSIDTLSAALSQGKVHEQEQRRVEEHLRDDEHDGAPRTTRGSADFEVGRTR